MDETPDYYEILGVSRTADETILKAAYRARVKTHHPDSVADSDIDIKLINEAYEVLSDPDKRAAYDAQYGQNERDSNTEAPPDPDAYEDTWGTEETWSPQYEYSAQDFAEEDPRKLAGFDAWANLPITPEQLSWMPEVDPSQPTYDHGEQPAPRVGNPTLRFGIWGAAWLVSVIAYGTAMAHVEAGILGLGCFLGAAIFGLPRIMAAQAPFVQKWSWLYYAFAVGALPIAALVAAVPHYPKNDISWFTSFIAILITTALIMVTYTFAVRSGEQTRKTSRQPTIMAHDPHQRQWGEPGRGLNDPNTTPFSQRNTELGFSGEILTSQLIDTLTIIPGVRVVHGIHLPEYGPADIDHVILCGNILIPVDSKHWPGGNYYWLSGQIMSTTPSGFERRGNPMEWALNPLRQYFPDKQLIPVVVIHSHDGDPIVTNNRDKGDYATLMSAMEFVENVGRICVDQRTTRVDHAALTRLIHMML